ncbi:hypothetical protein NDU88_002089 [Pleurodeles waltl]|uniref:Uncharacterized protein n=1 Tax=Pleurodeles waltl TaxID=8319 RepID=A0AAV7VYC5_PLEWA|nr:hypothetical protein NDU88_002089 [Pleurodeles waltl]
MKDAREPDFMLISFILATRNKALEQPAGRNTRFVHASAFPPRRPLTSRPSSLQIGRGVMRRLNIEDRLVLSLRPRVLAHVRQSPTHCLKKCSQKSVAGRKVRLSPERASDSGAVGAVGLLAHGLHVRRGGRGLRVARGLHLGSALCPEAGEPY